LKANQQVCVLGCHSLCRTFKFFSCFQELLAIEHEKRVLEVQLAAQQDEISKLRRDFEQQTQTAVTHARQLDFQKLQSAVESQKLQTQATERQIQVQLAELESERQRIQGKADKLKAAKFKFQGLQAEFVRRVSETELGLKSQSATLSEREARCATFERELQVRLEALQAREVEFNSLLEVCSPSI
jgi:uncharacterized protein (DUF3084 family)